MTDEQLAGHLTQIERILDEIEALDRATNGRFRQAEDREAFDLASRIERQMRQRELQHEQQ